MCQMKKRKFRAMTIREHCASITTVCDDCEYCIGLSYCYYSDFNQVYRGLDINKPFKTKDGKYIFAATEKGKMKNDQ